MQLPELGRHAHELGLLVSVNGPSVTVILPPASRAHKPSLLGKRPPVSTSVPSRLHVATKARIASVGAGGGGDERYDSECRMNVGYCIASLSLPERSTNERGADRHARDDFLRR
jgi:hypothetical protein